MDNNDLPSLQSFTQTMKFELCHSSLIAVGIICVTIAEVTALLMGHNGSFFNLYISAVLGLCGVPAVAGAINARMKKV